MGLRPGADSKAALHSRALDTGTSKLYHNAWYWQKQVILQSHSEWQSDLVRTDVCDPSIAKASVTVRR